MSFLTDSVKTPLSQEPQVSHIVHGQLVKNIDEQTQRYGIFLSLHGKCFFLQIKS